jgi:hypothetical protein
MSRQALREYGHWRDEETRNRMLERHISMVAKETSGIRLLRTIHWVLTFAAVSASSGLSSTLPKIASGPTRFWSSH